MVIRRDVLRAGLLGAFAAATRSGRLALAAESAPGAGSAAPAAGGAISAEARRLLATASLLYVATRRRNGERSSVAPIWFHWDGSEVFFTTSPASWKARRLRRGSPLYVWIGSADGPFAVGGATPVVDAETIARMGEAYAKKYWIAWLGFFRPRPDRVADGRTLAYRVRLSPGNPPPA